MTRRASVSVRGTPTWHVLPWGWRWLQLDKKIVDIQSGFAYARKKALAKGLPHLRPFNIGLDGELDLSEIIYILPNFRRGLGDYRLHPGDVLFNNTNSVDLVGKTALVRNALHCAFSNHLTRLRVKDRDALDPAWLGLWLRFLHQSGYFAKNCNKWIGQAGFPPTKIAELGIPIPELGEQYRIVARIEALMADLKEVRELFLQTQLELLAVEESLLELAYSIGGENGELPEGWRWASLSALCTINPRRPRLDRAPATPTSFVSMNAIDEAMGAICKIELRQYSEVARGYTYFEEGDVLFAKITPCMQNGKCAIAQGLADSIGFGSTEFHVLRPGPQVTSEWVHRYLRRRAFRAQAEKHFRGAVGQQRVPETFLKAAKIPTPPSKAIESRVIRRIDAVAAEVAEGNATIEAGLQQLAVAERSALDRAFRGEL